VGVLVFQFSGKEEPPPPRENANVRRPAAARPAPAATHKAASTPAHTSAPRKERQWPKIAVNEVLQHDPFALPTALQPPTPAKPAPVATVTAPDQARQEQRQRRREQALKAIRDKGVQMVFVGKEKRVAIIGDRRVRVGDVLEGFRVTGIGSDGVTLSEHRSGE
jgi:hypothetical protein